MFVKLIRLDQGQPRIVQQWQGESGKITFNLYDIKSWNCLWRLIVKVSKSFIETSFKMLAFLMYVMQTLSTSLSFKHTESQQPPRSWLIHCRSDCFRQHRRYRAPVLKQHSQRQIESFDGGIGCTLLINTPNPVRSRHNCHFSRQFWIPRAVSSTVDWVIPS